MAKNIVKLTENELRNIVRTSLIELVNEGYYGNDATPGQFVNTAREIANTYNDSQNRKNSRRPVSNTTVMEFIKQNGGLEKLGNIPLNKLMDMIQDYTTPERETIDFDTNINF